MSGLNSLIVDLKVNRSQSGLCFAFSSEVTSSRELSILCSEVRQETTSEKT